MLAQSGDGMFFVPAAWTAGTCTALMQRFIAEKPELWNEDIAEE